MKPLGLALGALLLLLIGTADASQQGNAVVNSWKAADKCAKQAQTAYPDYSAESNAERDAKLKDCLNASNLPPRAPVAQPGPR